MAKHLTGMKPAECIICNEWYTHTFYIVLLKNNCGVMLYMVMSKNIPVWMVLLFIFTSLLLLLLPVVSDLKKKMKFCVRVWYVNICFQFYWFDFMSGQIIWLCIALCVSVCTREIKTQRQNSLLWPSIFCRQLCWGPFRCHITLN